MTIATCNPAPSFPPADDILDTLAGIPWDRILDNAITLALWAAAIVHTLALRSAPYVVAILRSLADRIDAKHAAPQFMEHAASQFNDLTVVQLRTLARQRHGSTCRINGRRIAQANRAELIGCLS